jgi:hypothetical protein
MRSVMSFALPKYRKLRLTKCNVGLDDGCLCTKFRHRTLFRESGTKKILKTAIKKMILQVIVEVVVQMVMQVDIEEAGCTKSDCANRSTGNGTGKVQSYKDRLNFRYL